MYGVPYMKPATPDALELTLRGFSPRELNERVEQECRRHFGGCAWEIAESRCIPCMGTLGGRVRLYETHVVATGELEPTG